MNRALWPSHLSILCWWLLTQRINASSTLCSSKFHEDTAANIAADHDIQKAATVLLQQELKLTQSSYEPLSERRAPLASNAIDSDRTPGQAIDDSEVSLIGRNDFRLQTTTAVPNLVKGGIDMGGAGATSCTIFFVLLVLGLLAAFGRWEFCRLIPFWHCAGFGLSIIGCCFAFRGEMILNDTFDTLQSEGNKIDVSGLTGFFISSFTCVIVLNVFATMYGFVGNGCCRESLFGHSDKLSARCLHCCMGPALIYTFRFLLWLSILSQVTLSYLYLMLYFLLLALSSVCGGSQQDASSLVNSLNKLMRNDGVGTIDHKFIVDYCKSTNDTAEAALVLFIGCIITIVSQTIQLTALATEQERISNHTKSTSPHLKRNDKTGNARAR